MFDFKFVREVFGGFCDDVVCAYDNNETPDQQQEDNAVTEQTNTPEESTPVTQDNN
jgi:hypothetical protein